MKAKISIIRIFTFLCIAGLLLNSGAVFAQGEGEPTPTSNTAPTIILTEPQQNITIQTGEKVSIAWTDDDPDDNASVSLAYDVDSDPANDDPIRWIAQNLPEDPDEDGDRFEWDTTGIPAGTYYLWAVISDSVNAPTYALAAGTLTILEAQSPTEEPTQAPTEEPTAIPTEEPTQVPSEEPTVEPTAIPTQEPTRVPTTQPTQLPTPTQLPSGNEYYTVSSIRLENGSVVMKTTINGPSEAPKDSQRAVVSLSIDPDKPIQKTQQMAALTVPAFNWSFGCSATSAAMIAGYYDRYGYPNIYTGPTNDGVMPLDNSSWPDWVDSGGDTRHQCPLSATHLGLDDRTTRGHVDDYWVEYGSTDTDPWVAYGSEHAYGDCTADYMKTSQNQHGYSNSDGATSFYWYSSGDTLTCDAIDAAGIKDDGTAGFRDFLESRGYAVTDCYMKATSNQSSNGFTFAQYKAEIDAGYPVMIQLAGHTVVGVGYDNTDNTVILHDTWDYENHTMTWGGSYAGMQMWGVSIVHINDAESKIPTLASPSGTIADSTPTYSWSKVNSATNYQFQLYKGSSYVYGYTVSASTYCGSTTCSVTPTPVLSDASYQWHVRAYVNGEWQSFSNDKTFTLSVPVTPAPVSPNNTLSDTTPTYTWSKISGATNYQYQLYKGSSYVYSYAVSSSVCGTSKCSSTPTKVLATGSYQWRVRAYVNGAWKTFSAFKSFKVSLSPTPILPYYWESSIKPTYVWSKISGASQYQYQLMKGSTLIYTQTVTSSVCGSTRCTSTPTTAINGGSYQWRVRAYLNGAWQAFSPYMDFENDLRPYTYSPENTITDTTPTYSWLGLPEATKYELQLYKGSTQVYAKTVSSSICFLGHYCDSTPTTVLSAGSYKWRVRAYINNTWQAFSAFTNFTLASSGSEYFNTQFNSETNFEGWAAGPGGDWFVEGGNLHTTGLSSRDTSSINYERATNLSNFTYEVRMKMADPMNDWDYYGLIVRGTPEYDSNNDWTNGYYFLLEQDSPNADYVCFEAYQITDGQWTSLTGGYMNCYDSITFAEWNDFKVVANGTNIKFYVNEDLLLNTTISGSMSGRVGIFTWHYYDDFEQNLYIDWAKAGLPTTSDGAQEMLLKPDKIIKSDLNKFKTQ